jgi:hypothetical protein
VAFIELIDDSELFERDRAAQRLPGADEDLERPGPAGKALTLP